MGNLTAKNSTSSPLLLAAIILFINVNGFIRLGVYGDVIATALVVATFAFGAFEVLHAALLTLLLRVCPLFLPKALFDIPATPFLIPFLLSLVFILPFPKARATLSWARRGEVDRMTILLMGLTGVLSTVALIAWAFWTDNLGVGGKMVGSFVHYPLWQIVFLGIPIFALVNAFAEEVVYRGVAQEALCRTYQSGTIVIFLQAIAFAAAHVLYGFPNGLVGYAMVFVYGGMLGYLRFRTNGMLAPYITHVLADLTIGLYLYFRAIGHR